MGMDAPSLHRLSADARPFSQHLATFSGQAVACAFSSLNGDALLVAPANATGRPADYPHLAAFLRGGAPSDQVQSAWAELGKAIAVKLNQHEAVWVSTDFRSVSWTHLRVDMSPKYFKWSPYKRAAAWRALEGFT